MLPEKEGGGFDALEGTTPFDGSYKTPKRARVNI
jgi:hypothetical protein